MSDEIEMRASEEMPSTDAPIAVGEKGGPAAFGMPAATGSSAAAGISAAAGAPAVADVSVGTPAVADVSAATEDAEAARTPEEVAQIHARNDWLIAADQALSDLRRRSRDGKLTTSDRWVKRAFAPAGTDARTFAEELLAFIEERPHAEDTPAMGKQDLPLGYDDRPELDELGLDDPLPEPEVTDIVILYGKSGIYLYSKPLMSHSFAHALFNTAEGDDLATFADVVRTESRVYPRPVAASDFLNQPYLWSASKVAGLFERAMNDEAYADIEITTTSLNESFFYSTRHLSPAQGKALAEWYGVEKFRNP